MTDEAAKFIQITGADDIFALDGQGNVWRYQWASHNQGRPEGWVRCAMTRLPDGPPPA